MAASRSTLFQKASFQAEPSGCRCGLNAFSACAWRGREKRERKNKTKQHYLYSEASAQRSLMGLGLIQRLFWRAVQPGCQNGVSSNNSECWGRDRGRRGENSLASWRDTGHFVNWSQKSYSWSVEVSSINKGTQSENKKGQLHFCHNSSLKKKRVWLSCTCADQMNTGALINPLFPRLTLTWPTFGDTLQKKKNPGT